MLLQLFTGKTDIQKFLIGTSKQRLRGLVAGRLGDQMMRRSRDVHRRWSCMLVINPTQKTYSTYFDSLLKILLDCSSEKFSEQYSD